MNPQLHPQFKQKAVVSLFCIHCHSIVTNRGMRAILLGNLEVELYSTDQPIIQLLDNSYKIDSCHCLLKDGCCLGCGNVIGYYVDQPCLTCLESCHNGHYYMFTKVYEKEQYINGKVRRWDCLGVVDTTVMR